VSTKGWMSNMIQLYTIYHSLLNQLPLKSSSLSHLMQSIMQPRTEQVVYIHEQVNPINESIPPVRLSIEPCVCMMIMESSMLKFVVLQKKFQ
jgi:hypothetical protein